MQVVIALDSFKGSLTSREAGEAVKQAVHAVYPQAQAQVVPLADGGEGTVAALSSVPGARVQTVTVTGPVLQPVEATYCILPNGTAVMEMASAAGLTLVPAGERDPMHTTTRGVGELILHAIDRGCRQFILGIGGSATNDAGAGMLAALGYDLLDVHGQPIPPGAAGLSRLHSISADRVLPQLQQCRFQVACDVRNPLCGENGCSAVFAPQKGAAAGDIPHMDRWIAAFAVLAGQLNPNADPECPGAGAAGGLGFALQTFTNASLDSGIRIVMEHLQLEAAVAQADLVITGEGRLDGQSIMGKAPVGVAQLAAKYRKPVIAFAGCLGEGAEQCNVHGIDAFFPILPAVTTLAEAMEPARAAQNLRRTATQALRLIRRFSGE